MASKIPETCPHSATQHMGGACEACIDASMFEQAKGEILADMAAGTIPPTVREFSVLHDYVDANDYLATVWEFGGGVDGGEVPANRLSDRLDEWLRTR